MRRRAQGNPGKSEFKKKIVSYIAFMFIGLPAGGCRGSLGGMLHGTGHLGEDTRRRSNPSRPPCIALVFPMSVFSGQYSWGLWRQFKTTCCYYFISLSLVTDDRSHAILQQKQDHNIPVNRGQIPSPRSLHSQLTPYRPGPLDLIGSSNLHTYGQLDSLGSWKYSLQD